MKKILGLSLLLGLCLFTVGAMPPPTGHLQDCAITNLDDSGHKFEITRSVFATTGVSRYRYEIVPDGYTYTVSPWQYFRNFYAYAGKQVKWQPQYALTFKIVST
ncbi:MAG: hypothetical protein K1X92_08935 [Bacteroidia bacterium]|nr:hypothetical protein [Bacteroidia bacterium]